MAKKAKLVAKLEKRIEEAESRLAKAESLLKKLKPATEQAPDNAAAVAPKASAPKASKTT